MTLSSCGKLLKERTLLGHREHRITVVLSGVLCFVRPVAVTVYVKI